MDSCKSICGSFVEVDQPDSNITNSFAINPMINLVHDTARRYEDPIATVFIGTNIDIRYLIQTRTNPLEDHASMAILSSAYLASSPFRKDINTTDILEIAYSGYYGLQDYAVSSWQNHISHCIEHKPKLSSPTILGLRGVLRALLKRLDITIGSESADEDFDIMETLKNNGLDNCIQRLEHMSSAIRETTETIQPKVLDARTRDVFLSLNGEPQYKCPKPRCLMFSQGFENKKARNLHAAQHHSQFSCSADGCPRRTIGFTSREDLDKHIKQTHASPVRSVDLFPLPKRRTDIWSDCAAGDIEAVKDFHEKGGDLRFPKASEPSQTPVVIAARNGHLELCQYLIDNGCEIFEARHKGSSDITALGEAIKSRNMDLLTLLMDLATEKGTHDFINGHTFIHHMAAAVNSGERKILDIMSSLHSRRQEQIEYRDILHKATFKPNKSSDAVSLYKYFHSLAPPGGVLSFEYLGGSNILLYACSNSNNNAVAALLQHMETKDIHKPNKEGETPFYKALEYSATKCVELILEHDLANDMAVCDGKGNRPLHVASMYSTIEILKLILPYSLHHLNDQNADGKTPIQLAGRDEYKKVKALLETRAVDLSKRDKEGETVFDKTSDPEVLSLLHAANAHAEVKGNPISENMSAGPADHETTELMVHDDKESFEIDDVSEAEHSSSY